MPPKPWLEALPGEILYAIFEYLELPTLKEMSRVNKRLRDRVLPILFRHIAVDFSQESIACLNNLAGSNLYSFVISLEFQVSRTTEVNAIPTLDDLEPDYHTGSEHKITAEKQLDCFDQSSHRKKRLECEDIDMWQTVQSLRSFPRLRRIKIALHQLDETRVSLENIQDLNTLCQERKYNVTRLCTLFAGITRARWRGLDLESVCLSNVTYPAFSTDGERGGLTECLLRLLEGVPFLEVTGGGFPLELLCRRNIGLEKLGLQNLTVSFHTLKTFLRANSGSVRRLETIDVGLTQLPESELKVLSLPQLLTRD
ncbi:hypothetical protein BO99DRAFT_215753 [Aspergillus violaceofuscus CBS 115571]|uniref:F-box domain-containing protein n=1 Tax=Aspergillus violaceofuscus (strain CBS 115571) TaxID=1450538 RepID=A0A2V5H6V9_ASPV1|nr:hypothetical protein BO99DRAFT_215753 [Aspergillus violaceofuscus CBS 115571]